MSISVPEPTPFPAVTPEEPAAAAARLIASRRVGAVPVQDRAGRLIGLVSEHDIVRVVASRALGLRGLAVEEVMTREPVTVPRGTSPETALELMRLRDLRHLPVCCEEGRLVGLLGLGDLMPRG
jgi:CBS domain-containing protein